MSRSASSAPSAASAQGQDRVSGEPQGSTMTLRDSPYAPCIKGLLMLLPSAELHALARTSSRNYLLPAGDKEAADIILRYTDTIGKLFSYRRITCRVLAQYLHSIGASGSFGESKYDLVERVKEEWEKYVSTTKKKKKKEKKREESPGSPGQRTESCESLEVTTTITTTTNTTTTINTTINIQLVQPKINVVMPQPAVPTTPTAPTPSAVTPPAGRGITIRSDAFSVEFSSWFYQMLNRLQPQDTHLPGHDLSPEIFVSNCSLDMYLYGCQTTERHAQGPNDCYLLLRGVCVDYRLSFTPNLDSGLLAVMSPHGLLKLFCCGTLQEGEACVGVFEQEFGLVKCPEGRWKVMVSKVNLKQAQGTPSLPSLPKAEVFEIAA